MFIKSQNGREIIDVRGGEIELIPSCRRGIEPFPVDEVSIVCCDCVLGYYRGEKEGQETMDMIWSAITRGIKGFRMPQSEVSE